MLAVIKTLAFLCACFLIFYFSTTTFFLCCQFCAETLCIDFIENVKGLEFKCINLSVFAVVDIIAVVNIIDNITIVLLMKRQYK